MACAVLVLDDDGWKTVDVCGSLEEAVEGYDSFTFPWNLKKEERQKMYRVMDNKDGSVVAIVFSPEIAQLIVDNLPVELADPNDELLRYAWEDCSDHPQEMIGDTLAQLGRHIQLGWQK